MVVYIQSRQQRTPVHRNKIKTKHDFVDFCMISQTMNSVRFTPSGF